MKKSFANKDTDKMSSANAAENSIGSYLKDNRPQSATQKKVNKTGLPDQLKSGVESLSGIDMSDTKVHYNSSKPAELNAYAFAQGNQIHLASGQEKHLAHEAWHVVQQKQGRVQPTTKVAGAKVNDNPSLESEAHAMGSKALQMKETESSVEAKTMRIESDTPFQLFITKDPRNDGLGKIISELNTAYSGEKGHLGVGEGVLVDRSVVLEKALKVWHVNDRGRTLFQEIDLTLKNFPNDAQHAALAAKEVRIKGLVQRGDPGPRHKLYDEIRATATIINTIQGNRPIYPQKKGAATDVYNAPKEHGLPSSGETETKADALRRQLMSKKVWKLVKEGVGHRLTAKGYMIGVVCTDKGQFAAAYSGHNPPHSESGKDTFASVARSLGMEVVSIASGNLSTLQSFVSKLPPGVGLKDHQGHKAKYKVIEDKPGKEDGVPELNTCAGAKLAGAAFVPVFLTEIFVQAPGESTRIKVKDSAGQEQHYDERDAAIPSCINCQHVIPFHMSQKDPLIPNEGRAHAAELVKAKKHMEALEEVRKLNPDHIVSQAMGKISAQNRQMINDDPEIRKRLRVTIDKALKDFELAFQADPDGASANKISLESVARRAFGSQSDWEKLGKQEKAKRDAAKAALAAQQRQAPVVAPAAAQPPPVAVAQQQQPQIQQTPASNTWRNTVVGAVVAATIATVTMVWVTWEQKKNDMG